MKPCALCGKPLVGVHGCRKKCDDCRAKPYTCRLPHLTSGQVGAVGELLVSADLLTKGFEVFRSVSQSCSCDLIALKDGRMLRIEARTGYRTLTGDVKFPRKPGDDARSDHYAIVLDDGIVYQPPLAPPV